MKSTAQVVECLHQIDSIVRHVLSSKTGQVVWFTGLSGAGKTTLCATLAGELQLRNQRVRILDGDEIRNGLCSDLGFSMLERAENIRRLAHVANLLAAEGGVVLVAAISPLQVFRDLIRSIIPGMLEVFVAAPLAVCEERDPKGLYKQARAGLLKNFTGVDSIFESPTHPDVLCRTDQESVSGCTAKIMSVLLTRQHTDAAPSAHVDRRPTIAVDFDGVIADYDGWKGAGVLGHPRKDVVDALIELKRERWKILIHTTRGHSEVGDYLRSWNIPFDEINRNSDYKNQGPKPVATVYWDDRALCYSGDAAADIKKIREFKTWSGRT